jgi:hypothetical protein
MPAAPGAAPDHVALATPTARSRQVRRAVARQARRLVRRQAVHADLAARPPRAAIPAVPVPAPDQSLYESLLTWLETLLAGSGHSRPTQKRLALLGASLLAPAGDQGAHGTPAGVAHTAFGLGIGTATQEASVARRVARLLDDPHLDPARLLPDLTRALLPVLLAEVERAHAHTIGTTASHAAHTGGHHGRWLGVRVVVDETTKDDGVHVLVLGAAYRGIVVPLALRTWPQNQPLPEGAYWDAVGATLWEVHAALPAVLRAHVLVLADRGYGVPTFLDLLTALGWQWVVRVQGQTRLRFPDGTERVLREVVPAPGSAWVGGTTPSTPTAPLAVFKKAGWRHAHVVAVWATGQAEPWLLVTSLRATATRWRDCAVR